MRYIYCKLQNSDAFNRSGAISLQIIIFRKTKNVIKNKNKVIDVIHAAGLSDLEQTSNLFEGGGLWEMMGTGSVY